MALKPKTWSECEGVLRQPEIVEHLLQIRLLELAMNQDGAVAVRAIELLRSGSLPAAEDQFAGIPPEKLREITAQLDKRILEMAGAGATDTLQ